MNRTIVGLIIMAIAAVPAFGANPPGLRQAGHVASAGCEAGGCATDGCVTAECGGCDACGRKAGWGGGCRGSLLSRLGAFFCYKSIKGGCDTCASCATPCSTPLYLYFFRDCSYRAGGCCHPSAGGAVNPNYSRSVFPTGHAFGGMPAGLPGNCGR